MFPPAIIFGGLGLATLLTAAAPLDADPRSLLTAEQGHAVDMRPENGFAGKLADGRKISVIEILAADAKGTIYAFKSDGTRIARALDVKAFDTTRVRKGSYVVLIRMEGHQAPGVWSVGKIDVPSRSDTVTSGGPQKILSWVELDSSLVALEVMPTETGATMPETVLRFAATKPTLLAKINAASESVEMQADFEGKISFTNSQKPASPGEVGGTDGRLVTIQNLAPNSGEVNVVGRCADGFDSYAYPSNLPSVMQLPTMFFRFGFPEHKLKSIDVEMYTYEHVRLLELKLPALTDRP